MNDFGLYVIATRPLLGHEQVARICVRQGVRMLQLREKHLPDRELLDIARRMREITAETDTLLVINDRPDIAALCGADGVHLGQGDISPQDARRIVGPGMMIGLSTHSVAQAREALAQNPSYIGFGPIWTTPTKEIPDPAVGTGRFKEVLGFARIPVVAIGGIFPENVCEVLASGARNIAMVRYFMDTPDTEGRIARLMERFGSR